MRYRPRRAAPIDVTGETAEASLALDPGPAIASEPSAQAGVPPAHRVIAFSAIATTISAFGQTQGISVFIDPLIAGLSISRAEISTVYSVASLGAAFAMPWVGRQIDVRGVRTMSFTFSAIFGAVLLWLSQVTGVVALFIGFLGARFLGQGAINLTARVAIALRFRTSLGRAVGLSGALGAIGLSTMPVVLSALIERSDWRTVWVLCGITVWAVMAPLTLWALPASAHHALQAAGRRMETLRTDQWTRNEAIRSAMFWAITATVATNALVITGLSFHQISLLGEAGLSPTRAAANYLPQTVATVSAIAIVGALSDRLPGRLVLATSMTFLTLATVTVHLLDDGLVPIVYALLLGAAGGTGYAAEGVLYPRYFGTRAIAEIRGIGFTTIVAAAAVGPVIVGVIEERTGGYALAATVLMFLPIAVVVMLLFVRVPVRRPGHGPAISDA